MSEKGIGYMKKPGLKNYFVKELGFGWHRKYQSQAIFNFLMNTAEFCRNGVILDAGAGRQRYKPFFEECIYISQEHDTGIQFKNMQNIEYDLISPIDEKIPLKNNSLDGVLSTSVIEHLGYPHRFFFEVYRVLKPGGKIFINVPFCHFEHEIPFDFNRPTRYGLEKWLKDAGFTDIVIKPSSSSVETVCALLPSAFLNDLWKSTKCGSQIINDMAVEKRYAKLIFKLPLLFVGKISRSLIGFFCDLAKFLLDRGPHEYTNFPIGWLAVAKKPGDRRQSLFKDKKEFLDNCRV